MEYPQFANHCSDKSQKQTSPAFERCDIDFRKSLESFGVKDIRDGVWMDNELHSFHIDR